MELLQIKCPTCHSVVLKSHTTYATQHHGRRIIYKCANCPTYFSETTKTLMAGVKTPVSVIWQVVKARTEGMGLNAAARTFEKAKNTILAWERKFRDLHQVLFLYALVHEFIELVIEGDEAYTGIHVKRDKLPSIAYSEELISFAMSATLQSTDRRHGIVGQERCHFQRDS